MQLYNGQTLNSLFFSQLQWLIAIRGQRIFSGGFVKPLALPHMQVCGTPPYGIILYGSVITKTVADYVFIVLVFAKLFILLIKPNVETAIAFFKAVNVEVVYQDFGEDGSE